MQNNSADPVQQQRQRDREMRAAVDVMFEALAHIQASLETSSETKRRASYKKFKEALYERFEHILEEQEPDVGRQDRPTSSPNSDGSERGPTLNDSSEEQNDTLEKMWPAIAEKA